MIHIQKFHLASISSEEEYLNRFKRTCYDSFYPYMFFPNYKELADVDFSHITIFCGSNGSGKSTLLNVIAEKLGLKRETPYNKTDFFDPYLNECCYELNVHDKEELKEMKKVSRIITSDDVFNHILNVRERNERISFKRGLIFDEKRDMNLHGWNGPRSIDFEDPESVQAFMDYHQKFKQSASKYVRHNIGVDERTYSNGENGFKYFTDAIQPGGLYLLDEPENSLSAEMQIELAKYIIGMTRFYDCQFVMSTHSPFLLSIPYALIFNMDEMPVRTCKWTELPNIRIYYDFFKEHLSEFDD